VKAIVAAKPGEAEVLELAEAPAPLLVPGSLRIRVAATAVNRADLLQRRGFYPPPPGASSILGLECAGEVVEVGPEVRGVAPGARVMALLAGGGYAEEAVVDHRLTIPVPDAMNDAEAGAFPEVFLTAFSNLFMPGLGALAAGEAALERGGGGGVGTAAILLLREAGNTTLVTAGSEEKCRRCVALGATAAIDYRREDFAERARELTGGRGVNVILDHIGARYLAGNLTALAPGGRLVLIGLMGGAQAEVALGLLLMKRLAVIGSTLRSRPVAEKAAIVAAFRERFGGALAAGRLKPVVDRILPLGEVASAHRLMQASEHFGKIVLRT
jgi:putative PIG3 family NAD(P)H quinone oxidoreductase